MELKFDEHHCYRYDDAANITPNSEIYKAMDLSLGRTVALKKVHIIGNNKAEKNQNLKKALSEVKTMVQISEITSKIPNIYSYYYDDAKGELYIVMQWICGETLADKMKHQIPVTVFLRWMEQLAGILKAMSTKNFQHKDIKPENIMFNGNNELYLIDFNISVSAPNQFEGTPFYKAPEMDFGSMTAARDKVDMFAMGVILYQYVTKVVPQRMVNYDYYGTAGNRWDVFKQPIEIETTLNRGLNNLIVKLMEYDPGLRYQSYSKLITALKTVERSVRNEGK